MVTARFLILLVLSFGALRTNASTISELVEALKAADQRQPAIEKLLKMGADAEAELRSLESEKNLTERQQLIVRRLLGEIQIKRSPLATLDLSKLVPLGEDKEKHQAGNPEILIDPAQKLIVIDAIFAQEDGLLEYLVASFKPDVKVQESIVGVKPKAGDILFALLARGFNWSGEIGDDGKVNMPKDTGVSVSIEFEWETPHAAMGDPEAPAPAIKKRVRVPIEYFAWNTQTKRPMKSTPFAFNGSTTATTTSGRKIFMADLEGAVLAAKLDPNALMNSPLDTHSINPRHGEAGYIMNRCLVPKAGAKCRVVFEQFQGPELTAADLKDTLDSPEKAGK
jgi:hypothetical protein